MVGCASDHDAEQGGALQRGQLHGPRSRRGALHAAVEAEVQVREVALERVHPLIPAARPQLSAAA